MMDLASMDVIFASKKRARDDSDDTALASEQSEKKARHTSGGSSISCSWPPRDSVISTPTFYNHIPTYDSDDQSSVQSELGSPRNISISSGAEDESLDDAMEDVAMFSSHLSGGSRTKIDQPSFPTTSPIGWSFNNPSRHVRNVLSTNRVATPTVGALSPSPAFRTAIQQHIRHRHPQQHLASSDLLEVPPSIDEDEVATPPSAAEAAGSRFSMLSVNDMDVEPSPQVPAIAIQTPAITGSYGQMDADDAVDYSSLDADLNLDDRLRPSVREPAVARRQRMRSCALSAGNSPTRQPSPFPMIRTQQSDVCEGQNAKRTLSLGFRADCEKCRSRVPGHMNHFVS